MKKYFYLYVLLAVAVISGSILYGLSLDIPMREDVDLLTVNAIVKSVEQGWPDLLELHGSSFKYRICVIDNSGQLIWSTDREVADTPQEAMRKGYAILDITKNGDVVGKVLIETNSEDFNEQVKERFAKLTITSISLLCMVSALFIWGLHTAVVKPFSKLESFAHKISTGRFDEPLPMDKNNIFGLFTQSFDVMRSSLLDARRSQMEAEQAKKELIASLSHDIKTPVTSIRLIVELLLEGIPETQIYDKLKAIEAKADQITRLMNDMMHSTLEELGELKVNISSESSTVLYSLFESADPYGRVNIGTVPQCMIDVDITRMEQVVGNILTNSYKYAGTNIDVECAFDGDYLRTEVNDYGDGVDPDAVELVCSKFYRGENAKISQKDGEGLGLYVANLLMEKMGGVLEVYNRSDGFSVRLMLKLSK